MGLFTINTRPTLRACMLGPRAVGKTSVLTSIFAESKEKLAGTQLYIRPYPSHQNTAKLEGYRLMLENAIETNNPAALPASMDETEFKFEIGTVGNPHANVDLLIKDYPGEYLTDVAKQSEVKTFIKESNIVLIAIDTPYMMEGESLNIEKNKPSLIKDFLQQSGETLKDKLILFVPLKCERYFHDGKMDDVVKSVKNEYGELKEFFTKNNVASYVVSIQTLGGIEFEKMIENQQPFGISKISKFRIYEKKPVYNPLFCSQPLFYLLTYVAHYNQWQQTQRKGLLDKIKDTLSAYLRKDAKFFEEIYSLRKNILINKAGCEIITNNLIIQL